LWVILALAAPAQAFAAESAAPAADLGWLQCMGALGVIALVVASSPLRGGLMAAWKAYGPGASTASDDHAPSGH
jgi:hypothetical protein